MTTEAFEATLRQLGATPCPCPCCYGTTLVMTSPQLDALLRKLSRRRRIYAVQVARELGIGEGTLSKQRRGEATVTAKVARGVIEMCQGQGIPL